MIDTILPHILRASPFHVYHTIDPHITSTYEMNMNITFINKK
jgi:hypothetical protein